MTQVLIQDSVPLQRLAMPSPRCSFLSCAQKALRADSVSLGQKEGARFAFAARARWQLLPAASLSDSFTFRC